MVLGYAKPLETNKVSKENGIRNGMKGAWICQARMNQIPASARPGGRETTQISGQVPWSEATGSFPAPA